MPDVPAVTRVVKVLRLLADRPGLSMTALSEELGIPKTTTFRLLSTLEAHCLVEKGLGGKFKLGLALVSLGNAVLSGLDLRSIALPIMNDIVQQSHETCHLAIFDPVHKETVYVEKVEGLEPLRLSTWVGGKNPAHCTACGKALLSLLNPDDLDSYLRGGPFPPFTVKTITSPELLREEIKRVKQQGYSVDNEERDLGVVGVGCPIADPTRRSIAAISLAGPAVRMSAERVIDGAGLLLRGAATISNLMGRSGYNRILV